MKQSNIDQKQHMTELDQELSNHISAVKAEELTEQDYQTMENNLQKVIAAAGNRESQSQSLTSEQSKVSPLTTWFRWISWQPIKLASSMGAILAVVLSLVFISAPSQSAFAAVIANMHQATSMIYTSRVEANGMHLMDVTVYYRPPSGLRIETANAVNPNLGKMVNVMDLSKGRGTIFFPSQKIANTFTFSPGSTADPISAENDPLYWYQQLKDYQGEPAEILESKVINGVLAEGFVIHQDHATITVWADRETQLPIQLLVSLNRNQENSSFSLTADLQYNETLDDSLFLTEVSSDYQIRQD
jgi:outer membrane lipoprotein-sorting protein